MSRTLPTPPLSTLPLSQIQALANDSESITDRPPRDWFERARHEADLAVIAERKGKKEEMFLAYTRACAAYMNVKMHPDFGVAKKGDAHWAGRVKDFKEVSAIPNVEWVSHRDRPAHLVDLRGVSAQSEGPQGGAQAP
jgi:ubiquitin carboxyl-terminal hydrolase 8